jgi:hypothetical protein
MRSARLQTNDLGRADQFFGTMLSKEDIKESEKGSVLESPLKAPQVNGGSLPFRTDAKPRFSDPPAPPPQQPLPEKPDVARSHGFDPTSPASSLKRTNAERPRSVPSVSPIRQEPTSQIIALLEALESAKKEISTQNARMHKLEEMLQKERQARELAEDLAKRLESQSSERNVQEETSEGSILEEAFDPPLEVEEVKIDKEPEPSIAQDIIVDTKAISDSTALLEKRLETMMADMKQMREQMESFKQRAETAEAERDTDRKTLTEMVEKIRTEESGRRSSSTERARSPAGHLTSPNLLIGKSESVNASLGPLLQQAGLANGSAISSAEDIDPGRPAVGTLSRPPGSRDALLYNTTPYASMLGVVLIGMGLMAYLNGWQSPKVDR